MFTLPKLSFSYDALEPFMDKETVNIHYNGHHATYIKNLNDALVGDDKFLKMDIESLLKSLDNIPENIRTKVKNNAGGHFHHLFFWQILGKDKGGRPKGKLKDLIDKTFGDFDSFKNEFNQKALSLFGSGWTWLLLDKNNLVIENTQNQDSPVTYNKIPILTIDLWEHAYYLKYKNKRPDYINSFWNIINWEDISKKFVTFNITTL